MENNKLHTCTYIQLLQKTYTLFVFGWLCFGCTWQTKPEPYREKLPTDTVADLLIEEYSTRFDDLSDRCREHLHNVIYVERGYKIDNITLGSDLTLKGEHYYNKTSYIWIKKSLTPMQYNNTLVHELIHALLACLSDIAQQGTGNGDNDHNEPDIWCTSVNGIGYGCRFNNKDNTDSLEYFVVEMIRYFK